MSAVGSGILPKMGKRRVGVPGPRETTCVSCGIPLKPFDSLFTLLLRAPCYILTPTLGPSHIYQLFLFAIISGRKGPW